MAPFGNPLAPFSMLPTDVLPRRQTSSDRVAGAAEEIREVVLRMRPGDKLIIERHEADAKHPERRLFTLTERRYG
jgi:hypothetical protein